MAGQNDTIRGVALVLVAALLFALSDVVTKHLVTTHNVALISTVRYAVNLILLVAIFAPRAGLGIARTDRTTLVLVRGACLTVATVTMGLALRRMPVAETVAIIYLAPFAVMLLAGRFLGEHVGRAGWIAAFIAFAGVLLILRPGSGLDTVGVVFALINAASAVVYSMLSRDLARTETIEAMLFHTALMGTVLFSLAVLMQGTGPLPTRADLGLMVLLGAMTTLGHILFTWAFRLAPASTLAPVTYMHMAWAVVLGLVVFGHMPDALSLAGMGLVLAGGALTARRSA